MFQFVVSDYNQGNSQANLGFAPITNLESSTNYSGIPYQLETTDQATGSAIATNSAGTVTATLPANLQIPSINFRGRTYRSDEFNYNEVTGAIIFESEDLNSNDVVLYFIEDPTPVLRAYTGEQISSLLKSLNIVGSFEIIRRIERHPTLTLQFYEYCDQLNSIEAAFCPGLVKAIKGNWRILDLTIEDAGTNQLLVTIQATGLWAPYNSPSRNKLDEPVGLKKNNLKFRTIGGLAGDVGVPYSGKNIKIRIPRNTSSQEFTTVRRELEERAVIENGFIYYDDPNFVRTLNFGTQTTHIINKSDIYDIQNNPIIRNYVGAGTEINGVKLSDELRNTLLQLNFDEEQQAGQVCRYEFINADNLFEVFTPAEKKGFALFVPDDQILRDNSRAFDAGGNIKEWLKFTEFNGVPLKIEREQYGYIFSTLDTYNLQGTTSNLNIVFAFENLENLWLRTLYSTSYYVYDKEGYLIRTYTVGAIRARVRKETEENEAIVLLAQAVQAGLNLGDIPGSPIEAQNLYNQALAYSFTEELPINDSTDYALQLFRDFYPDIGLTGTEDPNFIDAKFFDRKIRFRDDIKVIDNPDSNDAITLPPIPLVKTTKEEERVDIVNTDIPNRFNRKNINRATDGASGVDAIAESVLKQNIGRPPIHTRLEVEAQLQDNLGLQNFESFANKRYTLNTPNSGGNDDFVEQTISFPDVDNPTDAKEAAENLYTKLNTLNAQTIQLTIRYRNNIKVGDTAVFDGRKYIITEIFEIREVDYLDFNGFLALTMGQFVSVPVQLSEQITSSASATAIS